MKKILIISTDNFPNGNAGALRQETLSKLMVLNGYKVDILGYGPFTNFEFKDLNESIKYLSYRGKSNNLLCKIRDRLLFKFRVKKYVNNSINDYKAILFVSIPLSLINFLKKVCHKNKIILIHDSVEWYSPSEFVLGIFSPFYIEKNLLNQRYIDSSVRVIGISSFLSDYFNSKGCITTRIPFICDTDVKNLKSNNSKISFVYAGQMGNKDHLNTFLEAVSCLDKTLQERITIDIFGPTFKEMKSNRQINEELYNKILNLNIHGRVDRNVIMEYLSTANFTILFRNSSERYSKAGFPTKVVESLCMNTPVLCNLSSDLGMYLIDGVNSIISKSERSEDILDCLVRILTMSESELLEMQCKARELACTKFDYRLFKKNINDLLTGD